MNPEKFNPSDEKYKKVEDLPEEEQDNFVDVEDGFVRREAYIPELHEEQVSLSGGIDSNEGASNIEALKTVLDRPVSEEILSRIMRDAMSINIGLDKIMEGGHVEKETLAKALQTFPNDENLVRHVYENYPQSDLNESGLFYYISRELKNNKDIVLLVIEKTEGFDQFEYASDELKNDEDVVRAAVKRNTRNFYYASQELKNNREFVANLIDEDPERGNLYNLLTPENKQDLDLLKKIISKVDYFGDVPEEFLKDPETIEQLVEYNGEILGEVLTSKRDFSNPEDKKNIQEHIFDNKELIIKAINNGLRCSNHNLPRYFYEDKEIYTAMVKNNLTTAYDVGQFENDPDVVFAAVNRYPIENQKWALNYIAGDELKKQLGIQE